MSSIMDTDRFGVTEYPFGVVIDSRVPGKMLFSYSTPNGYTSTWVTDKEFDSLVKLVQAVQAQVQAEKAKEIIPDEKLFNYEGIEEQQ